MFQQRKFKKKSRACKLEEDCIIWHNVHQKFKLILKLFGQEEYF